MARLWYLHWTVHWMSVTHGGEMKIRYFVISSIALNFALCIHCRRLKTSSDGCKQSAVFYGAVRKERWFVIDEALDFVCPSSSSRMSNEMRDEALDDSLHTALGGRQQGKYIGRKCFSKLKCLSLSSLQNGQNTRSVEISIQQQDSNNRKEDRIDNGLDIQHQQASR